MTRDSYDLAIESRQAWRRKAEEAQAMVRYLLNALKSIDDVAVQKQRGSAVEMQRIARIAMKQVVPAAKEDAK